MEVSIDEIFQLLLQVGKDKRSGICNPRWENAVIEGVFCHGKPPKVVTLLASREGGAEAQCLLKSLPIKACAH